MMKYTIVQFSTFNILTKNWHFQEVSTIVSSFGFKDLQIEEVYPKSALHTGVRRLKRAIENILV